MMVKGRGYLLTLSRSPELSGVICLSSPQVERKQWEPVCGIKKRTRKPTTAEPIRRSRRPWRKWLREPLRSKPTRLPTRPSTRSPLASQPEADRSFLVRWGAAKSALSSLGKRDLDTRRNEVSTAYENHDVGFHRGFAPGGVTPPHRESPAGVRSRGLYVGPPGGHAGGSRWQVPLGDRIQCDCFSPVVPLAPARRAFFWLDLVCLM